MREEAIRFAVILLCAICAIVVSKDAHRRGMNGHLWGLMIFLFSVVALPIYFIVRKPLPKKPKAL